MNTTQKIIFLFFLTGLCHSNCLTRQEIKNNQVKKEDNEFLEMFETTILQNKDDYFITDTGSFGVLYNHPENENKFIRVFEDLSSDDHRNVNIAAAYKASEAQEIGGVRWAPIIYQSICVLSDDRELRTIYRIIEKFYGDVVDIFSDDEDFYNFFETPIMRMKLYVSLFEKYQKLQQADMKHCDIRPQNFFYKQVNESEYLVLFTNFTTLQRAASYCFTGSDSYRSPEVTHRPCYSTDAMKLKSELFGLAMNVIRMELDFYNTYFQKQVRNDIQKMDANDREYWTQDESTADEMYKPIWAAVEKPDWFSPYFQAPAKTEDKYNMLNIFNMTLNNMALYNEGVNSPNWQLSNFYTEIDYYLRLIEFGYNHYFGNEELKIISYNGMALYRNKEMLNQYKNFFVVIARNIKENSMCSGRVSLETSLRKMKKDVQYYEHIQNHDIVNLKNLTKSRKIKLNGRILI